MAGRPWCPPDERPQRRRDGAIFETDQLTDDFETEPSTETPLYVELGDRRLSVGDALISSIAPPSPSATLGGGFAAGEAPGSTPFHDPPHGRLLDDTCIGGPAAAEAAVPSLPSDSPTTAVSGAVVGDSHVCMPLGTVTVVTDEAGVAAVSTARTAAVEASQLAPSRIPSECLPESVLATPTLDAQFRREGDDDPFGSQTSPPRWLHAETSCDSRMLPASGTHSEAHAVTVGCGYGGRGRVAETRRVVAANRSTSAQRAHAHAGGTVAGNVSPHAMHADACTQRQCSKRLQRGQDFSDTCLSGSAPTPQRPPPHTRYNTPATVLVGTGSSPPCSHCGRTGGSPPRAASVTAPGAPIISRAADNSTTAAPDIPRLIWKIEREHAAEAGRLHAELRAMRREVEVLRHDLTALSSLSGPKVAPRPLSPLATSASTASACSSPQPPPQPPACPAPLLLARGLEELRAEVRGMRGCSASTECELRGALSALRMEALAEARSEARAEVQRSVAGACDAASSHLGVTTACVVDGDTGAVLNGDDDVAQAVERRLQVVGDRAVLGTAAAGSACDAGQAALEVRVQVAALNRQVGHLRDASAEAKAVAEEDQAALRALLRASRMLAERLGVGPVLLGRPGTGPSIGVAAEAEALAAGVAYAWRRQKAAGAIPMGAANVIELLEQQRVRNSSLCMSKGTGATVAGRHAPTIIESDGAGRGCELR